MGNSAVIAIVDYGMGNLRSVEKAFAHLGADARVTAEPKDLENAAKIVLPGVGAFDQAVVELQKRGLFQTIQKNIRGGKPFLGLCLGLQLLFESSDEGKERGFGILPGRVKRFEGKLKIPHMGWNRVELRDKAFKSWDGIADGAWFYFVHSFYAPDGPECAASTEYGARFASVIAKDNVLATQFHPEKSQENGLRVLKNFAEMK